ncbi:hypothetical protein DYB38_001271 [Aphanomyces astaci]|uniref:Uncharacterized protein n=1 Tax=Aphanomyces astaci TaxID=112090 RepID=A0A397CNR1_APHAT|nr:hypothetical protein DYB38_001271 [Aphanomyces astaci]
MVLRGSNQVAAALFLFADDLPRPTTASAAPATLTRKKTKAPPRKLKSPETLPPNELRPNEQYADQLTGLLGKERKRLAQQVLVAAEKGNTKAIYLLLHQRMLTPTHCIGMVCRFPMGETALHLACYGGHVHVVECFLDKGANIHAVNKDVETALFYAARKGHFRVVRLLLRREADMTRRNRFDDLPEDEASNDVTRLESLGMAMQVCFRWYRAADTPRLWKSLGVSRWELSLNKSVGLGVVAPMTGYRPTPRRRPSTTSGTSTEAMLNATGHLGYHHATPSKLQLQHHQQVQQRRQADKSAATALPPRRPQTAMRLVQYR